MKEYQVQKHRRPITLFLVDGLVLEGWVFLSEFAADHQGPEGLLDLMLDPTPFFPLELEDGSFRLVGKSGVAHARGAVEHHPEVPYELTWEVRVIFVGGDGLPGALHATLPPGQQRLQDYLSQVPPFLPLFTDQFQHVINLQHVREILPLTK